MTTVKASEMTLKNHNGFFGDANNTSVITLETAKADPVLDWTVEKSPVYVKDGENFRRMDDTYLLKRSDNGHILSTTTVKHNYEILQNQEALNWFNPYLERDYLELVGYGYFNSGKTIFVQAFNKFKGEVAGDEIESYFLLKNHHTGGSVQLNFCTQRAICKNTLDIASKQGNKVKVRHNHMMFDNLEAIHARINLAKEAFDFNIETYNDLARKSMDKAGMLDILTNQFADELKKREKKAIDKGTVALPQDYPVIKAALNAWDNDATIQHLEDTAWKAYNAFNGVINHGYGTINPEKAFERTVNGGYINKIVDFKRLALKV